LEIHLKFAPTNHDKYGIYVRQSPDHREETLFYYDNDQMGFYVNRNKTTLDSKEVVSGIQGGEVVLKDAPLELNIF